VDWHDIARLRSPDFTIARRGYDKHEVDKFLEQLVDWLETDAAQDIGEVAVTRKLELVGKSTAHILLTTEQEAQELKRQTEEDCAELRAQAEADAQKLRANADDDARRAREEATAEATKTIEEGRRRRGQIDHHAARSTTRSTSSRTIAPACSTSWATCAPNSAPRSTRTGPHRRTTASPTARSPTPSPPSRADAQSSSQAR
jgi:DivIVA domain-containing protein